MNLSPRATTIGLQILMLSGFAAVIVIEGVQGGPLAPILVRLAAFLLMLGALIAYVRKLRYAEPAMIVLVALIVPTVVSDTRADASNGLALIIPAIFALLVGRPLWVLAAAAVTLALFLLRDGGALWEHTAIFYPLYVMVVGGMALARAVTDAVLREVQAQAQRAEVALGQLGAQAAALAEANRAQEQQLAQQQRLLDLVASLETPLIALAEGVLFVPIVGHLDSRRSQTLKRRMLNAVHDQRVELVVIDIAGVSMIDEAIARALLEATHALRLLGCRVALSGISPTVAPALARLDVNLSGVITVRSPQEALAASA